MWKVGRLIIGTSEEWCGEFFWERDANTRESVVAGVDAQSAAENAGLLNVITQTGNCLEPFASRLLRAFEQIGWCANGTGRSNCAAIGRCVASAERIVVSWCGRRALARSRQRPVEQLMDAGREGDECCVVGVDPGTPCGDRRWCWSG